MLYLQSFFSKPKGIPASVARYQPKGYSYSEIMKLAPIRQDGTPIKKLPPMLFLKEYMNEVIKPNDLFLERLAKKMIKDKRDYTFCCWCDSKRQKDYDRLFCHTIIIGYFMELFGISVEYLDGRDKPIWSIDDFLKEMEDIKHVGS